MANVDTDSRWIRHTSWKDGEYRYCRDLVGSRGDSNVGSDPKTIATYLRLQASSALRDGEYEISARLGVAATAINEDARNNHTPAWQRACDVLDGVE
jgi:hypothetical protein